LQLRLAPDARYAPLVHGLIDQGAALHGLEQGRRAALAAAAVSVFKLLCETAAAETRCELRLESRPSCVELVLTCGVAPDRLACFNCLEPEAAALLLSESAPNLSLAHAPLYGVDRLRLTPTETGDIRVTLRQEKEFGRIAPSPAHPLAEGPLTPPFALLSDLGAEANDNLLYAACLDCQRRYPPHLTLKAMLQPAKFTAMLKGGELKAAFAIDAHRRPAGLLCWERTGKSNAIFFGPYVLGDADEADPVAELLVEAFLNDIARTDVVGVFSGLATPELPAAYFERLGQIRYWLGNGESATLASWYRHMREDYGGAVWRHPALADFLEKKYADLGFVRELRELTEPAPPNGSQAQGSLFAIDIRRELAEAVIRPLEKGPDLDRNLDRQLSSLTASGVRNIFFHVDLAFRWQAGLTPALIERGFVPGLLLPCAGRSDILVFHYDQDASL
jgi:hypothetical protein